jgi:signal transduction histidine kinase
VNQRFIDEIGYDCTEMPTIAEWYELAYPDPFYRKAIINEWNERLTSARTNGHDSVTMNVVITTRNNGELWYEVKSSIGEPFNLVAFVNIQEIMSREKKLQELSDIQNKVLSILAHDVRIPVSNLFVLSKFLLQGDMSMAEFLSKIQMIYEKSSQVLEFIDTTLLWTKSNFDNLAVTTEKVDLHEVAEQVLSLYHALHTSKNISVQIDCGLDRIRETDRNIITVILRNLISNAIKFTPDNGKIRVIIETPPSGFAIHIKDTGIGMSPETIEQIHFEQYKSTMGTRDEKGLGIGLRLCKHLTKRLGGQLQINSLAGNGTAVSVRL